MNLATDLCLFAVASHSCTAVTFMIILYKNLEEFNFIFVASRYRRTSEWHNQA